ncbi:MAG TPA: NAD(P)H-hydrate dehydratase, partial [Gillisia sp.]|nr:NAD(P)H-hydrate dehydratase [Gillisia sp.]
GDGLVVGRLLREEGYNVSVYIVNFTKDRTPDFLLNYNRLKDMGQPGSILLQSEEDFPQIPSTDFVIDAIFGIGLNRAAEGWVAALINHINNSKAFILSIDMPSGLFSTKALSPEDAVIKANYTITFQAPKLVFYLPQTAEYAGDIQVLDIGLDRDYLNSVSPAAHLIDKEEALKLYIPRKLFTHKGDYGHSLIIGGSYGKIGSISLTATSTLRTGAGLVTIYSPECGYQILQSVLPEAMVLTDEGEKELSNIKFDLDPDVICFGMGAGTSDDTLKTYKELLKSVKKPMVIDADGLNMLAKKKELLELIPPKSVLTPHPKELEKLIGKWKDDFEKINKAKKFSKKYDVVLVMKDAHTLVIYDEDVYINNTGNPGMATAGAGDVLAGVITGLISQKYTTLNAAVLGTYIHGKAGDIAAEKLSYQGMIAGDITLNLGNAFLDLFINDAE